MIEKISNKINAIEIWDAKSKQFKLFAYGNQNLETWFISQKPIPKINQPKGTTLLFYIMAYQTTEDISIKDTYPTIDDVFYCTSQKKWKIKSVEWV